MIDATTPQVMYSADRRPEPAFYTVTAYDAGGRGMEPIQLTTRKEANELAIRFTEGGDYDFAAADVRAAGLIRVDSYTRTDGVIRTERPDLPRPGQPRPVIVPIRPEPPRTWDDPHLPPRPARPTSPNFDPDTSDPRPSGKREADAPRGGE